MRRTVAILCVAALAAWGLSAGAAAQDGQTVSVTATAGEQDDCPSGDTYCWLVEGAEGIEPGDTVEVTVVNPSDNSVAHNFYVMFGAPAETGGNTDGSAADHSTDDVAPGEETTLSFEVPEDADEIYGWCDVAGHEQLGMWELWEIGASGGGDGGDGGMDGNGTDGDGADASPGLGLLAALAGMGLAAAALARRR